VQPEIEYARIDGAAVAYQVLGSGPDLVFLPEWVNNLEMQWQDPRLARFPTRLASFSRLVMLNPRGIGLSDALPRDDSPTIEHWMDDITTVLDAIGSSRSGLIGTGIGGSLGLVYAATYPERVSALVLVNATARSASAPDYPFGIDAAWRDQTQDEMARSWGRAPVLELRAPELAGDGRFREWYSRFERYGASPGMALDVLRMIHDLDVRHVLPSIQCPVVVVQRRDDRMVTVEHGRYLAEHIPGARFVELPGAGHAYWSGDQDEILDEIQEFLTGAPAVAASDRVLATILFTDIVASTALAARLGDARWSEVLEDHRVLVRRELDRFRGREIDTAGDGFLATFDGPARAIRCAAAIREAVAPSGLRIRAGLHTGEIEVRAGGVAGIAVHIAARVLAEAGPGEIVVSRTVVDLVAGSGIEFVERGAHDLKGVPGRWELYRADLPPARPG
jgi:pimeloyl-ACP methyl ester carboxylesterase